MQLTDLVHDIDLELVVFNAGVGSSGCTMLGASLTMWQDIVRSNVVVMTECLCHLARRFMDRRRGGLLIVSSAAAFGSSARAAIYTATKGYAQLGSRYGRSSSRTALTC